MKVKPIVLKRVMLLPKLLSSRRQTVLQTLVHFPLGLHFHFSSSAAYYLVQPPFVSFDGAAHGSNRNFLQKREALLTGGGGGIS